MQHSKADNIVLGTRLPLAYLMIIAMFYRHPDPSSRPDFVSVVQQLSLPDTKLLLWSKEDRPTDPEAATLGAELDKAMNLYKSLQEQYK